PGPMLCGRARIARRRYHVSRIARAAIGFAVLLSLGGLAAGPGGAPASKGATPESCAACLRASNLEACHRIALGLADEHDYARAIAIEEQVIERQPSSAAAATLASMVQLGTQKAERSIALYHSAPHATSDKLSPVVR